MGFNFRFHHSILSKYIMLLRNMARMSIARNSKSFIHSTRVCAEESQTLVKKAAEGDPRPLYLDAQATTPLDPRVLDAMLPYMMSLYGNPHSRTHAYGWESESAVEKARKEVADIIGADAREIIFTSGATESNNISVKGVGRFYKSKKNHVITT